MASRSFKAQVFSLSRSNTEIVTASAFVSMTSMESPGIPIALIQHRRGPRAREGLQDADPKTVVFWCCW